MADQEGTHKRKKVFRFRKLRRPKTVIKPYVRRGDRRCRRDPSKRKKGRPKGHISSPKGGRHLNCISTITGGKGKTRNGILFGTGKRVQKAGKHTSETGGPPVANDNGPGTKGKQEADCIKKAAQSLGTCQKKRNESGYNTNATKSAKPRKWGKRLVRHSKKGEFKRAKSKTSEFSGALLTKNAIWVFQPS